MPIRNIQHIVLQFHNGTWGVSGNPHPSIALAEADARSRAERNPGREFAAVSITSVFGAPVGVERRELQAPNDMGIGEDAQPVQQPWAAPADADMDRLLNPVLIGRAQRLDNGF